MAVKPRPQRHATVSMSAPIGGLNVRDSISAMPGTDAINLVNWIPQQYGVRCRKGYSEWATNLSGAVRTLMSYQPNRESTSSYKLFAATDNYIYNVTTSTNAPSSVVTMSGTLYAGRMSSTMFSNSAGNYLLACSHLGGYWTYDGATWTKRVAGAGVGEVNGVNPDNLVSVFAWKRRLWFVEKDSSSAWYMATDAITGTITELDLGPFAKHGGKLAFITNWTIDAGEGIDDLLVFVFENGDVLIYKGTDPASASTFSLVGAWYIGAVPIGRRGFCNFGGDVLIMSELGIQPLSYVTRGGQSLLRTNATDYLAKVQPRFAELFSENVSTLGWDILLHPRENLLMVVLPAGATGTNQQYALYTNTNGWCILEGMPIRCGVVSNNDFYFGDDDGNVHLGFDGYFDAVPYGSTVGSGISGVIQPSFSYFQASGRYKHFLMVRPTFLAVDTPSFSIQMSADFEPKFADSPTPATGGATVSAWDTATWDESYWGGALSPFQSWTGVEAFGYTGSPFITTSAVGDTFLVSLDYMYEYGGSI